MSRRRRMPPEYVDTFRAAASVSAKRSSRSSAIVPGSLRCRNRATSTRFSRPLRISSTAANCPVRLMDSRTSAACVATSKPLTLAVPASALSSVDRIFTTVVLPAPFEPSRAKMLPRATSKSTPRSTSSCLYDFSRPCTWMAWTCCAVIRQSPLPFRVSSSGEAVDRLRQALALLVDPLLAGVGLGEGLGELDRVVTDDRAHRRSVGGGALPEVGEVAHHLDDDVARGDAPVVHEVPLERLRGGAVRFWEGLDAGLVLPVLLLLLERSRDGLDPVLRP